MVIELDCKPLLIGCIYEVSSDGRLCPFDHDLVRVTVRVPILLVKVDNGGCIHHRIKRETCIEPPSASVKMVQGGDTLRSHQIASGQCFHLPVLKGAIQVVESFGASASRRCQILVKLELPVGPPGKQSVTLFCDLCDLRGAGPLSQARTKLAHEKGHS